MSHSEDLRSQARGRVTAEAEKLKRELAGHDEDAATESDRRASTDPLLPPGPTTEQRLAELRGAVRTAVGSGVAKYAKAGPSD